MAFKFSRRVSSDVPVPEAHKAEPGYPLPDPAPQLRQDVGNRESRRAVIDAVGSAGEKVYGHPITMRDATYSRVAHLQAAVDESPTGVPEGLGWYGDHRSGYSVIASNARSSVGRAIDIGAILSPRNTPTSEKAATGSALHIAGHPDTEVVVTEEMSPMVGDFRRVKGHEVSSEIKRGSLIVPPGESVPSGAHRLGSLSPKAIASLGFAAHATGDHVPSSVSDVQQHSASRDFAAKAVTVARDSLSFSDVSDAPKTASYATNIHLGGDPDALTGSPTAYNTAVLRRRHQQVHGEEWYREDADGNVTHYHVSPDQGSLFSASELSHYTPNVRSSETAEDVYMNAVTAERAAARGGGVNKPMAAMDLVSDAITKGRGSQGLLTTPTGAPNISKEQVLHAFNNEATIRATELLSVSYNVRGEEVTEALTAGGAQAVIWTHARREMGEDPEWNARQRNAEKSRRAEEKKEAKHTKERERRQGTLEIGRGNRLRPKFDQRSSVDPLPEDPQ